MVYLMVSLPVVFAIDLSADIPPTSKTGSITIPGFTEPDADIVVLVNGKTERAFKTETGDFRVKNLAVPPGTNQVLVRANDGTETADVSQEVIVDTTPPKVSVTIPISPSAVPIQVNGTTDEAITVSILTTIPDETLPDPVSGLAATKEDNRVQLRWTASASADVKGYTVRRNGKLIATVAQPEFLDEQASAGRTYTYTIQPVDNACNIGGEATIQATTTGNFVEERSATNLAQLDCEPQQRELPAGPFSIPVDVVADQPTRVIITTSDSAGNTQRFQEVVLADIAPPTFLETNLQSISPSYSPVVNARGRVSEKASVTVFVNGDAQDTVVTDDDGSFVVKVKLERKTKIGSSGNNTAGQSVNVEFRSGFVNEVKLVATDKSGQIGTAQQTVEFLRCGTTGPFRMNFQEPFPAALTPHFLQEQIQQVGIPFNVTYRGTREIVFGERDIALTPIQLAGDALEDYDNDFVSTEAIVRKRGKEAIGFAQIKFDSVPDLVPEEVKEKGNVTEFDKEKALAEHRKGQCKVPGFGCMKLLLELSVQAREVSKVRRTPGAVKTTESPIQVDNVLQKSCIQLEVLIDQPIPRDKIPKGFLKTVVEVFQRITDAIDVVLDPVRTIGTYTLYGCGVSIIFKFVQKVKTRFACEFSAGLSQVTGVLAAGSTWESSVARAGMCDYAFPESAGDPEIDKARDSCKACQSTVAAAKKFNDDVYKPVCDRVSCPAAPTTQFYIKDAELDLQKIPLPSTTSEDELRKRFPTALVKIPAANLDGYYLGSDCAVKAAELRGGSRRLRVGSNDMEKIYREAQEAKTGSKECEGLHPAMAKCCGTEYENVWGTACGLGKSFDAFNELKESTCLAEQAVGTNEIPGAGGKKGIKCGKLFNAVAGFCEPKGQPSPDLVFLGPIRTPGAIARTLGIVQPLNNDAYIFVIPKGDPAATPSSSQALAEYNIFVGYPKSTVEIQRLQSSSAAGSLPPALRRGATRPRLSVSLDGVPLTDLGSKNLQSDVFSKANVDAYLKANGAPGTPGEILLGDRLRSFGMDPLSTINKKTHDLYGEVVDIIGETDQQYIVKPNSGFLRSAQCLCFPALVGYLELWRNVLGAVKNCFNSVLLTGDGDTELCRAVLDRQICDMLYEVVRCFVQKYNKSGSGKRKFEKGSIGNVIGAISGAGQDVGDEVRGRYGNTGLYRALFNDRKLANALCAFAFTGTWNLDPEAIFQTAVDETPIDSIGLLEPCERRFIAFDPTTEPGGLTTWTYRLGVGLAAGANLQYELDLISSKGFGCDETDGFVNGECDCNRRPGGDCTVRVTEGSGTLTKNEILQDEVISTIQSFDPESGLRYDTARLSWTFTDNQDQEVPETAECKINHLGAQVPVFCNFDVFSLSFRCEFGETEAGVRINNARALFPSSFGGTSLFGIGDPLEFELDITQRIPDDPRKQRQARKILLTEVRNQNGQIIPTLSDRPEDVRTSANILDQNGNFRHIVKLGGFRQSDFKGSGRSSGKTVTITAFSKNEGKTLAETQLLWRNSIRNVDLRRETAGTLDPNAQQDDGKTVNRYLIVIDGTQGRAMTAFKHNTPTTPDRDRGFGSPTPNRLISDIGTASTSRSGVTFTEVEVRPPGGTTSVSPGEIRRTVTFDLINPPNILNDEIVQVMIEVRDASVAGTGSDGCPVEAAGSKDAVPASSVTWRATFTAFDEPGAGSGQQVSIDPESGLPAQETLSFRVICDNADDLQGPPPEAPDAGQCRSAASSGDRIPTPCSCGSLQCGVGLFCIATNVLQGDVRRKECSDLPPCVKSVSQNDRVTSREAGRDGCICLAPSGDPKDRASKVADEGDFCCNDGSTPDRFEAGCGAEQTNEEKAADSEILPSVIEASRPSLKNGATITVGTPVRVDATKIRVDLNFVFEAGVVSNKEKFRVFSSRTASKVTLQPKSKTLRTQRDVQLQIKSDAGFQVGDTFSIAVSGERTKDGAQLPAQDQIIDFNVEVVSLDDGLIDPSGRIA